MPGKMREKFNFYIFIIAILSVSVVVLVVLLFNMKNTAESLATSLIEKTTEEASERMNNYFDRVSENLFATNQLCNLGIINPVETEHILDYLLPVFNTYGEINTIAVADLDGREYSIIREDSTWLSNIVYSSRDSGIVIERTRWRGNLFEQEILREWTEYNADYNPITRPWFLGAMNTDHPDVPWWTQPYYFFTYQIPGITASIKSVNPSSKKPVVIQYDILLAEISEFTTNSNISENGLTFILTEDLRVIGLPNSERFSHPDSIAAYVLNGYEKIHSGVVEQAVDAWKGMEGEVKTAYSIEHEKETWWVKISDFELGKNSKFLIGVTVPENDFLSELTSSRHTVIGGFIVVMLIIVIVVRQYLVKQRMNMLLTEQKKQISEQRDEISKQHEVVVMQKQEITDSINYAKRIQEAILPDEKALKHLLNDYFIFFRPKDIVSGDFYWVTETEEWVIITAADCTGHGVPGAFMSMLGISFLDEIVRRKDITNAAAVLNELRGSVIEALKQSDEEDSQKDGMDMSIIAVHKNTRKATWAGAHNPLWIIRAEKLDKSYDDPLEMIEEIKADKMPVAFHPNIRDFSDHEISLDIGDQLYMFSDGFHDQFGGEKGKKLMVKNFKRMVAQLAHLPMKEQGKVLEQKFLDWINTKDNEIEQIDDVIVIGMRM